MMIKSYRKWSICTFPSFLLISNSPFCPPPISSNSMLSFSPLVCFSTCFFSFSFRFLIMLPSLLLSCFSPLPSSLFPLSPIFPSLLCLYSPMFFPFLRPNTLHSFLCTLPLYLFLFFFTPCLLPLSRQSNKPAFLISPSQLCSSEVSDSTIFQEGERRKEKGERRKEKGERRKGEEGGGKEEGRKCIRPRRSERMGGKGETKEK